MSPRHTVIGERPGLEYRFLESPYHVSFLHLAVSISERMKRQSALWASPTLKFFK